MDTYQDDSLCQHHGCLEQYSEFFPVSLHSGRIQPKVEYSDRYGRRRVSCVLTSATRTPSLKSLAMFRLGLDRLISSTHVYSRVRSSLLSVSAGMDPAVCGRAERRSKKRFRRENQSTTEIGCSLHWCIFWRADFLGPVSSPSILQTATFPFPIHRTQPGVERHNWARCARETATTGKRTGLPATLYWHLFCFERAEGVYRGASHPLLRAPSTESCTWPIAPGARDISGEEGEF